MLIWLVATAIIVPVVILFGQLIVTIVRNLIGQQVFKRRSPSLPVLPKPSILTGHAHLVYWSDNNWLVVDRYHGIYGETFGWYNVNGTAISTTDLDLIKTIIVDEQNDHINRVEVVIPVKQLREGDIVYVKDEQWRRIRKAMAPSFTNHKVLSVNVQDAMSKVIDNFIESIEHRLEQSKSGENGRQPLEIDADDLFLRFTIALIFSCLYKQENLVDFDGKEDYYVRLIDETLQSVMNPLMKICPVLPVLIPIIEWILTRFNLQGKLMSMLEGFIKEQTLLYLKAKKEISDGQLKHQSDSSDFIMSDGARFRRGMVDYIIDQFQAGKLKEKEYVHSTLFLFVASVKTTADALSRLAYQLAANQDAQDKLRNSISSEGIDSEYLHWCISESLRLFPPVTSGGTRIITRDINSKAGLIPSGSIVFVPAFTVHRLKDYWGPDADEFKPDRWRNSANFHPTQYLAFSLGVRNCLGKDLAMNTIKRLMVEMIQRYKFLTSPKTDAESIMKFASPGYMFLTPETPTYVKICPL